MCSPVLCSTVAVSSGAPPKANAAFNLFFRAGTVVPSSMLTNPRVYLDPLNFATNLVFFRDDENEGGHHTRLVTANYWSGYGAKKTTLWLRLYDAAGKALAEWTEELKPGTTSVVIDSKDVRRRFGLKPRMFLVLAALYRSGAPYRLTPASLMRHLIDRKSVV